jgi:hypothetical protein
MSIGFKLNIAALVCTTAAFSQILNMGVPDAFQVTYAANLNVNLNLNTPSPAFGDSFIDVSNSGASIDGPGDLCINIYAFDPSAELLGCCACVVTPGGLASMGVFSSLLSNNLTGVQPTASVIKMIATSQSGPCDPTSVTAAQLAPGMTAWRTTLHALPTLPVTYQPAEVPFTPSELSAGELSHLTTFCSFIISNGSGQGVCKGCSAGGLGADSSR